MIRNDKATWFTIMLGIIIASMFLTFGKKASLVIYYDEYPDNMTTQIFFDIGSGYSEEHSISCKASQKTELSIDEQYISMIKGLRIDFSDKEGKVNIRKIELRKNGLAVESFKPKDIMEGIDSVWNVDYTITGDAFAITSNITDGQICFNKNLLESVNNIYSVKAIEIIISFVFVATLGLGCYCRKRIYSVFIAFDNISCNEKRVIAVVFFILGVIFCYREYIFGDKIFLFDGIASDSFVQTYPQLYRLAQLLESGEELLGFDFAQGYGAVHGINSISFTNWVIWFGTDLLPYLMGIRQILNVVLAFILFYIYLKLLDRKEATCYIGAMSYALCGHMIIRQYWHSYTVEVVLSSFLLIALELGIRKRKYSLLPIAILLYCTSLGEYKSILVFGLVIGYTFFRYFELYTFDIKNFFKTLLYSFSAYVLALVGSFVYWAQPLVRSLSSDRMENGVSVFSVDSLFSVECIEVIEKAIVRTVSVGLEDLRELFYAPNINILDGPTFYCGLVVLLFIPFVIKVLNKKRKCIAGIALTISMIYIFFPNIRYIANGFGSFMFKLSSFWISILILYYGTLGIDYWLSNRERIGYWYFCLTDLIIVLIVIIYFNQNYINIAVLTRVIVFIIVIQRLIIFEDIIHLRLLSYLLIAIAFFDLFINARIFSNTDIVVTQEQLEIYDDDSIEYIKSIDSEEFYRIDKKTNSVYELCASLVQDYNGLLDYRGGTSMNDGVHRFLENVNIARLQPNTDHYMMGLNNANELDDILGVKYIITPYDSIDNDYGLELIAKNDGKMIYKNCNVLPIGFCYTSYIDDAEFNKLSTQEKRRAILDSCVLEKNAEVSSIDNKSSQMYVLNLEGESIPYEYDKGVGRITFEEIGEDKVIALDFDMRATSNSFGALEYGNSEGRIGVVNVGSEASDSKQSFVFTGNQISYFSCGLGELSNIVLTVYEREEYYQKVDEYLQDRKASGFECTSFSSNHITGTVNNDTEAILYFSIPYDEGWNIYIDGEKAQLMRVNYGFIGAYLPAGNHDVVLQYKIPYINVSIVVSIIGIVAIVIWFVYWRRQERREKKCTEYQ